MYFKKALKKLYEKKDYCLFTRCEQLLYYD